MPMVDSLYTLYGGSEIYGFQCSQTPCKSLFSAVISGCIRNFKGREILLGCPKRQRKISLFCTYIKSFSEDRSV